MHKVENKMNKHVLLKEKFFFFNFWFYKKQEKMIRDNCKLTHDSWIANWNPVQYNACLAITGAIQGTSKEKLYQELNLE